MSVFDRLDRLTSRQVDRTFAVGAYITAMTSTPNGRAVFDTSRGEIIVKGVFDAMSAPTGIEIDSRDRVGNDLLTMVNGERDTFSVDVARYPAAKDVRQGDFLTLDDARRFQVHSVQPDGLSRSVLVLTRRSPPAAAAGP